MIMLGGKYNEQFSKLEDRINEQRDEINSLRLELEAYRDHGVYIGKRYQHKDGSDTFEMNVYTYLNIKRSNTSFDDYVQVDYQPVHKKINSNITASIKLDTTDAEEEIDRLNKELVQFKSVPESVLKLLHKTLDEMSGGHTM